MDITKMVEMGKRIYNNAMFEKKDENGKVVLSDEQAINALVNKTFTPDGQVRDLEQFRVFNRLIVETAESEAQPKIEPIINLLADYKKVGRYDTVVYKIPKKARIKLALTATGAGVDFIRIAPNQIEIPAKPKTHQFGVYYNVDRMLTDPVNEFRKAVDYVAEYKVKYYFTRIMELVNEAKQSKEIPEDQTIESAYIDIVDYRRLENKLLRYGNGARPIMVADRNLIDALAIRQATMNWGTIGLDNSLTTEGLFYIQGLFATEDLKNELLRSTEITQILRTIAVATDNPFVDDANSRVELPVNEGIIIAGGEKSPFVIREFGGMRTAEGLPDIEDERVNLKIDFKVDITLLLGQALGYIQDTSVIL